MEELRAEGQLAEAGLGDRLDVAPVHDLGLEAVEVVHEQADGRGEAVGEALLDRDLVVHRPVVQRTAEGLGELVLGQTGLADVAQVRVPGAMPISSATAAISAAPP